MTTSAHITPPNEALTGGATLAEPPSVALTGGAIADSPYILRGVNRGVEEPAPAHVGIPAEATVTGGTVTGMGSITGPVSVAEDSVSGDMASAAQSSDLAASVEPHIQTPSDDARGITITTSEAEPASESTHHITPPSEAPYSPLLVKPFRDE